MKLDSSYVGDSSTLRAFAQREWRSVCLWALFGVLAAAVAHLAGDTQLRALLTSRHLADLVHYQNKGAYVRFAIGLVVAGSLCLAPKGLELISRAYRSWEHGVVSGLSLISFTTVAIAFSLPFALRLGYLEAAIFCVFASISYVLFVRANVRRQKTPREEEIQVSSASLKEIGASPADSDEPIHKWPEDLLDRSSLVNALCFTLLISKSPIVALFGEFGSGKSSILNLLRTHLQEKAIVVTFSTWLPGSPEVLASYLLSDIARECNRHFLVPGIRKETRKFAAALAKSVPPFGAFSDLVADTTQREDIVSMGRAVSSLPTPVIVLLDEVDRMQKEELLTLLKIVRTASDSPNLRFVYAFDRRIVETALVGSFNQESHTYFEKFFPVSFQVPTIDAATLGRIGTRRVCSAFERARWFDLVSDEEAFKEVLRKVWSKHVSPLCQNLRSVGLLANDLQGAARALCGEVNPVDLILLELIKRFEPSIYEIIWRYRETLTGGSDWLSGGFQYRTKLQKAEDAKRIVEEVGAALPDADRRGLISGILNEMFPIFARVNHENRTVPTALVRESNIAHKISDPSLIAAYFRYKLPDHQFSLRQLRSFINRFSLSSMVDQPAIFEEVFGLMKKGEPRRADFLAKLCDSVNELELAAARHMTVLCMRAAKELVYDLMLVGFGEAGSALRMIIRVGGRVDTPERASFLSACLDATTDDTLAFRILTCLSKPGEDFDLGISFAELYPSFVNRMRRLYGPGADAQLVDLQFSDRQAFCVWGWPDYSKEGISVDTSDRTIQREFWLKYIGSSRHRLAFAFAHFFLPADVIYREDPSPLVESMIPVADLRHLYDELPEEGTLPEEDTASLVRLRDFLDGKFANGTGPQM